MKKLIIAAAVTTALGLFAGTAALAQKGMQWRGGGGWGAGTTYGRLFDSKTVETIVGEVVSVDMLKPMKGMNYGIHAMLKTDKETVSVHLGPGWYIENQDVKIVPGDRLEVKGSRVSSGEKPFIIASEVKKGEEVLVLRDAGGFPAWAGWRRR